LEILDEATSALDSETEQKIQKALVKLLQGRTSIIITHSLLTIINADRIIVMKRGKINKEKINKIKKQIRKYGYGN
jgi:ABC-type multidrug transport system fused ATPase/permease subunit